VQLTAVRKVSISDVQQPIAASELKVRATGDISQLELSVGVVAAEVARPLPFHGPTYHLDRGVIVGNRRCHMQNHAVRQLRPLLGDPANVSDHDRIALTLSVNTSVVASRHDVQNQKRRIDQQQQSNDVRTFDRAHLGQHIAHTASRHCVGNVRSRYVRHDNTGIRNVGIRNVRDGNVRHRISCLWAGGRGINYRNDHHTHLGRAWQLHVTSHRAANTTFASATVNLLVGGADVRTVQLQTAPETATPTPAPEPTTTPDLRIVGVSELLQSRASGNVLLHPDGRVVYFGGMAAKLLAVDGDAFVQRNFFELLPPESVNFAGEAFTHARTGVSDPPFAVRTVGPRGPMSLALQFSPIVENGVLLAVMSNVIELPTRHAVNAALRGDVESSKQHAADSVLTVFHLDGRGQCTFMGDGWSIQTGQPTSEALGTGWLLAIPESDRPGFRARAGAAHHARHGWRTEVGLLRTTGFPEAAELAAAPIIAADGRVVAYVGLVSFHDASPSVRAQTDGASSNVATSNVAPLHAAPTRPVAAPAALQQLRPEPATHLAMTPVDVQPELVAQPPMTAPEKFALAQVHTKDWAPTVQEGYTDPSLLLDRIHKADAEAAQAVPEPRVNSEQPAVDKTTGLANKLLFAQHVQSTVSRMQSDALTVSVSFIDLHGLDVQRAAVGSRVANDYLFLLAKRLEATIRSIEIAGRIDGNILAVLSINWLFAEDLPVVAQRLMGKLGEPLAGKESSEMTVAMNLGMAVASPNEDVNVLFHRAWDALQRSKEKGSNEFEIAYAV
jgi:diguanylate cyclase (GGDEF)-like protein